MRTEHNLACLEDHGIKLLTDASASREYISIFFHWKRSTQIPNANQNTNTNTQLPENEKYNYTTGKKGNNSTKSFGKSTWPRIPVLPELVAVINWSVRVERLLSPH